jgi:hypothetical protein
MEMKRILTWGLAIIAIGAFFLYTGDYISLRYRIPGNRDQFGTVTVESYYAVPLKDGKTEFIMGDTQNQQCVNSLFPHFDCSPCWYANKKKVKRINM